MAISQGKKTRATCDVVDKKHSSLRLSQLWLLIRFSSCFLIRYNIQMLVLSLQDLIRITIEGIKFTSEFYSSKVKSKRVVRERNVKQHKI